VQEQTEDPQVAKWHEAARIYREKKSLHGVAEEMGVNESTVRYYLHNLRFTLRRRGDRRNYEVPDELIVELRDEYEMSFRAIAKEVGMSPSGVHARYVEATTGERPSDRIRPLKNPRTKYQPEVENG
ncbi:hypothetical protein JYK22_25095, partial [Nonomuraea sp. RK-328]|nr:hypothetical protein [Nonomuraea sp. RK-328]